jgi:beta-galactosidase/beta-glucuronidase
VSTPRPEHPRPDRRRDAWRSLNGVWQFAFDDDDRGLAAAWWARDLERTIVVPYPFQSTASGIGDEGFHPICWYRRRLAIPDEWNGSRILCHFGAVDYETTVFLDGTPVAHHRGGHTPFSAELTAVVRAGAEHTLALRVVDRESLSQPRGKQWHRRNPELCFYRRTTGIWQPVWLEALPRAAAIVDLRVDSTQAGVTVSCEVEGELERVRLVAALRRNGDAAHAEADAPELHPLERRSDRERARTFTVELTPPRPERWSPETPAVYELELTLRNGSGALDRVASYTALRTVAVDGGRILLNGEERFLRGILDQGYWPDTLIAPPSVEALALDVEWTKRLGFDWVRKHQKAEDPLYHYLAARHGLLVFSELPSAYETTTASIAALTSEWIEQVVRDRNFPAVAGWVPSNESWGFDGIATDARVVAAANAVSDLAHALDGSRPVVANDGWEHPRTDLIALHLYERDGDELRAALARFFADPEGARLAGGDLALLPGTYDGQPVLVSEYGGVAVGELSGDEWGYNAPARHSEELAARYEELTGELQAEERLAGYCYTQLTDVDQEVNGLVDARRRPKVDPERIAAVNRAR